MLLLSERFLSALMISIFSARHKLHLLVVFWYAVALLQTDHLMLKSVFLSFRDQTYFERAVLFLWLRCRIEYWWSLNRSLNVRGGESGVILPAVGCLTVARYTTDCTWQVPSIGQLPFVRKLHRLESVAGILAKLAVC